MTSATNVETRTMAFYATDDGHVEAYLLAPDEPGGVELLEILSPQDVADLKCLIDIAYANRPLR